MAGLLLAAGCGGVPVLALAAWVRRAHARAEAVYAVRAVRKNGGAA